MPATEPLPFPGEAKSSRPTICSECIHFRYRPEFSQIHPVCAATIRDFVTGGILSMERCAAVNTNGNCQKFKSAAYGILQKAKPWWKFWA